MNSKTTRSILLILIAAAGSFLIPVKGPSGGSAAPGHNPLTTTPDPSSWNSVGPDGSHGFSGRVTAIAFDPTDASGKTVYVGGAQGGVWKTTDGGLTWRSMMDNPVQPDGTPLTNFTIAVGSIAVDASGVIYVGTGEPQGGDAMYGAGVLKSTDGGATWRQFGLEKFWRQEIFKVAISPDPLKQNLIMVAATNGLWISTDGGNTWPPSSALPCPFLNNYPIVCSVTDVVFDPATPSNVYAGEFELGVSGYFVAVFASTNAGALWTPLSGGLPTCNIGSLCNTPTGHVGRITLAASKSSPGTVVAALHFWNEATSGVWQSSDSGTTWSQITPTAPSDCDRQCFYDLVVAIDPIDGTTYLGGLDLWRLTRGGTSWTDLTQFRTHADQHALAFNLTDHNRILIGNDGGVWGSTDQGSDWTNLNQGLSLTQFYRIAASPVDVNTYFGGTQDNGHILRSGTGTGWNQVPSGSGDGTWTGFDPINPTTMYLSGNGGFRRSDDGGMTWPSVDNRPFSDGAGIFAPITIDPTTSGTLYLGTYRLWKTTTMANAWSNPTPGLSLSSGFFSAIAVAPSNGQIVYAGTSLGALWVSTDGGSNFVESDTGLPVYSFVTRIAVDPANSARVVVTLLKFGSNVFLSNNAIAGNNNGVIWSGISANLTPHVPAQSVVVDSAGVIYVGSDAGVFSTLDGGIDWQTVGVGLPRVQVLDLAFSAGENALVAATHGRGVWTIPHSFDFSISNSGPIQVGPSHSGSDQVGITMLSGPAQTVSLSCPVLLGVSCDFTQQSGTRSFSATLTISLFSPGPTDSFILTVTGSGGGLVHTSQVEVIVFRPICFPSLVCTIPLFNIFLPSGTTFPVQPIATVGSVGPNNFVLLTGETTPYPPGKTMIISRDPLANSICIIDSPNLQALNQAILNGNLPPCKTTNLQATIAGSTVSEILLYCDGASRTFPRPNINEAFPPGTPSPRTYTCTRTTFNGLPAFTITGLAYSFVMTMTVATSVSSFFTDSDLKPLPVDGLGNPKVDVVLPGGRVRSTDPGQILAWANVTNTGSVPLGSLHLNETLPMDWIVSPAFGPGIGSVSVFFVVPNGTRLDITNQVGVMVTMGNPETLSLSIANVTSTIAGTPLLPGDGILISVKLSYGLKGTLQPVGTYPRDYADTVTTAAWTAAQFDGLGSDGQNSAAFKAYAKIGG